MANPENSRLLTPLAIGGIIFVLSLLLRISYVFSLEIDAPIRADAAQYVTIAYNLVNHGVYSPDNSENPQPSSFITPGYPLFLAAIFAITKSINATYHIALFLQAILGAISVYLTFLIALRILPYWASIAAGVFAAISPHLIVSTGYLLTETQFAFFLVSSTFILISAFNNPSKKRFFAYGILVGCAALTRPVALLLPVIAVLPLLMRKEAKINRAQSIALLMLGFIVILSPWYIWSAYHPTTQSNAKTVFAYGTYPDFIYKTEQLKGYPNREDPEFNAMRSDIFYALKILKERAANEPMKYFYWYFVGKPVSYWSWSIIQGMGGPFIYSVKKTFYDKSTLAKITFNFMKYAHFVLVGILLIGIVSTLIFQIKTRSVRWPDQAALFVLLILFYATLIHSLLASLPRYSIPFQYFMYIGSLFYLVQTIKYISRQKVYQERILLLRAKESE
jgi:4-amino-4-deoxy-L-arabinose transferase-like glycosyltransferase